MISVQLVAMFNKVTTLTEFILKEEERFEDATGSFTLLLTQIENAGKIIASHIKKTGLVDIIGATGAKNAYQEEVQKLDEFSNNLLVQTLLDSRQVKRVYSEELEKPVISKNKHAHYDVFIDPLDGSSNIDVNINIGTIFSIYRSFDGLQQGRKQIAAGYINYGSSVMFVYSCGNGVNGFTLDPAIGSFLLSHPNIKMPKIGKYYSINEGHSAKWEKKLHIYIAAVKTDKTKIREPYQARYVGSMIADVHRTLLKGGIFINPTQKLRLMFEVNPFAYIVEQAGGKALLPDGKSPLDIKPDTLIQKIPIALGSKDNIDEYLQFLQ